MAPRWRPAARVAADGVLRPTVLTDVHARHEGVRAGGVRPGRRHRRPTTTSTRRSRLANDTEYGLQAAIFTATSATALKAVRTLDFGGVLVNEVPTWRADQQPYGGLRDSGNTREGPAYCVKEMTEIRMVVINP